MQKKRICILGSTGSIGRSTLDVVAAHPDRFEIVGLVAGKDVHRLAEQIRAFSPRMVAVCDQARADALRNLIPDAVIDISHGREGACRAASQSGADVVVSAIVGAAGLAPTVAALDAGINVALANKEALVVAGSLVTALARERGAKLLPVDSEHSAIFQSLVGHRLEDVRCLILTASGGPFRTWPREKLAQVTKEQALNHPNWSMGPKITIDSASMMNKGLELIEAHWLFSMPVDRIQVLVHPQSIIHSMVEYIDGSHVAQLGVPDMRTPIAYALAYPERVETNVATLDLAAIGKLEFEAADTNRFPALRLAMEAARVGRSLPAVLNAANEIAVDAFLGERIGFTDIARTVEVTMQRHDPRELRDIDDALDVDAWARQTAAAIISQRA